MSLEPAIMRPAHATTIWGLLATVHAAFGRLRPIAVGDDASRGRCEPPKQPPTKISLMRRREILNSLASSFASLLDTTP